MSALPITSRVPRGWRRRSRAWRLSRVNTWRNAAREARGLSSGAMSSLLTDMPPSTIMWLMGGRTRAKSGPSSRPSKARATSARPPMAAPACWSW